MPILLMVSIKPIWLASSNLVRMNNFITAPIPTPMKVTMLPLIPCLAIIPTSRFYLIMKRSDY